MGVVRLFVCEQECWRGRWDTLGQDAFGRRIGVEVVSENLKKRNNPYQSGIMIPEATTPREVAIKRYLSRQYAPRNYKSMNAATLPPVHKMPVAVGEPPRLMTFDKPRPIPLQLKAYDKFSE